MQGSNLITAWMLYLVIAFSTQQIVYGTAIYSVHQICAQYGTGRIADPNSCESYGYCKNGIFVGTRRCPKGFIYNSKSDECDYPQPGICTVTNVTQVCKYATEGSFIADPTDCSNYCQCQNKIAYCEKCPSGQIFDKTHVRCVWKNQSNFKCLAESICSLVPNGKFLGDPAKCGQYLACQDGVGAPGQCPPDTFYNKNNGYCQQSNPCIEFVPETFSDADEIALPAYPEICKTQTTFPKNVADGKTCMGFYQCTAANGPGTWLKCPFGTHFNGAECVTPYTTPCVYDRCANINQTFVAAVGSQCRNYLICKNQVSQGPSSNYKAYQGLPCANNGYFNEFIQACENKSPASATYKLCP